MSRRTPYLYRLGFAVLLSLFIFSSAQAESIVRVNQDAAGVTFSTNKNHSGAKICITGPDGFMLEKTGASLAALSLYKDLPDGAYSYEVTFDAVVKRSRRDGDESSMQAGRTPDSVATGTFTILNSVISNSDIKE